MFWRGVIGYLPVNVVQGVVGLLTIVAFTRVLTPAQFGDYALGFSVAALVHTAVFTWNEAAMARFWVGESDRDGGADHSATIYRAWLLLLAVLPVAALIALALPMTPGLQLAVLAGLATVAPRTFVKLAQERRRAAGEVKGVALLDMGQTLGGFLIGTSRLRTTCASRSRAPRSGLSTAPFGHSPTRRAAFRSSPHSRLARRMPF